ncbi:MAG: hypothetical protein ACE5M4_10640 [Anaerolineales bacterium]
MTSPEERTRAPLLDRLKLRKPVGSRISEESYLYGRVIPALILFMGFVMVVLIVLALGVLVGVVR